MSGPKGYLPGPGAHLDALPYGAGTSVLAYRRDLFDQHGFKLPLTYARLQALLQPLELLYEIASTGPAGMSAFAFNDMLNAFIDGRSAVYLDAKAVFGTVRSSSQSRVDGKVAYALHPRWRFN